MIENCRRKVSSRQGYIYGKELQLPLPPMKKYLK